MTTPAWPLDLPQAPLVDGYIAEPGGNVIESRTEVGDGQTRRRATSAARMISATYWLTGAQLEAWEEFFVGEIAEGALWFEWPHPFLLVSKMARLRGAPRIAPVTGGTRWRLELDLLVRV